MGKIGKSLLVTVLVLLLAGCWDRVEIEERGFVIGAAIDTANDQESDIKIEGKRKENYRLTYQFVVPGNIQGNSSGGKQTNNGASGDKPYLNLTSEGKTIFQITRQMASETSRIPYMQHLKVILLSEELTQKGYLYDALDIFVRDHEMRRAAKVVITEGEAKRALEINAQNEKLPIMFINSISENVKKSARFLPFTNIGEIHSDLLKGKSFVVPRIFVNEKDARISGAAVFNSEDLKMIGTLNERETLGLNFIIGEVKSASIDLVMDDQFVTVEIKSGKSNMKASVSDLDQIQFIIELEAEGNVGESFGNQKLANPSTIATFEEETSKEIEQIILQTIEKVQKEYKADVLGLGSHLKEEHHQTWTKLEKDWDRGKNYFEKSKIDVQVKFKIRQIGASIETVK
ncbi:Ger(x)C family spore germination protein [Bacillus sp. JJ1474]|uniref:Ger(x)C family spore germination protein n=1 Tax=Bacillus sp. JJ1474 TaxID=3122955 RepID=UPI003000F52B